MPKNAAPVAMVATMGCSRPMMTMAALMAPQTAPVSKTTMMPNPTETGVPIRR